MCIYICIIFSSLVSSCTEALNAAAFNFVLCRNESLPANLYLLVFAVPAQAVVENIPVWGREHFSGSELQESLNLFIIACFILSCFFILWLISFLNETLFMTHSWSWHNSDEGECKPAFIWGSFWWLNFLLKREESNFFFFCVLKLEIIEDTYTEFFCS